MSSSFSTRLKIPHGQVFLSSFVLRGIWGDEIVLELDRGVGCTTLSMYRMSLNCHFKMINFLLCEFNINKKNYSAAKKKKRKEKKIE